ncbi:hypothetical protein PVAP13_9NG758777 [Panicum virgatum]|uniref:Uncharacterized protein n=1 Tax=Panicum virgatum TaxID=38727 RepID=A0A8T0N9S9_PANVG|nr:hypothetical protein PVAP13_9NG758777 [Panicum virgatum]
MVPSRLQRRPGPGAAGRCANNPSRGDRTSHSAQRERSRATAGRGGGRGGCREARATVRVGKRAGRVASGMRGGGVRAGGGGVRTASGGVQRRARGRRARRRWCGKRQVGRRRWRAGSGYAGG